MVTADRVEVPLPEVNASVTVVTGEEIERRQWRTLAEVLRNQPGLSVIRSGGLGKTTSVFTRGANSNQTLVIIDGVRQNDPANPTGAADLAHMLAADIERVEIVRGPMSTLYGSDAIGGVINVITRKGSGPMRATGYVEGGSYVTGTGAASVQGSYERFNYNLSLAGIRSHGDTVIPERFRENEQKEADPYRNLSYKTRIGYDFNDQIKVSWFSRAIFAYNEYDGFNSFTFLPAEDPNAHERTRQFFNRVQADMNFYGGVWKPTVAIAYADIWRRDRDHPDTNVPFPFAMDTINHGKRLQMEWKNELQISPTLSAVVGSELNQQWFNTFSDGTKGRGEETLIGNYAQARWNPIEGLFVTAGARLEHHDVFGFQPTGRVGAAYLLGDTGTKLKGSFGTAFRAPALFELYGVAQFCAGNRDLDPEKSWGGEAGIEQSFLGGKLTAGATFFYDRIHNLIVCPPPFTVSQNVDEARSKGVELSFTWDPLESVSFRGSFTYTNLDNLTGSATLVRRPKYAFQAAADWHPIENWTISLDFLRNGGRRDFSVTTFETFHPDPYNVFRLTTSYVITDNFTVFGRIENLFNKKYEEPDGFKTPHFTAYAGVRLKY